MYVFPVNAKHASKIFFFYCLFTSIQFIVGILNITESKNKTSFVVVESKAFIFVDILTL